MKNLFLIIALLSLTALSSSAQYSLMMKGDKCPFDSAVAVEISTYRLESSKFDACDIVIKLSGERISVLDSIITNQSQSIMIKDKLLSTKEEELRIKQNTIIQLTTQIQGIPKNTWWRKNQKYFYIASGFITGGAIVYFLKK